MSPKVPDTATKLTMLCADIDNYSAMILEEKRKRHAVTKEINTLNKKYERRIIKIEPASRESVKAEHEKDIQALKREKATYNSNIQQAQRDQKATQKLLDQIQLAVIHEAKEKRGGQYTAGSLPETSLSPITRFKFFSSLFGKFRDKGNFAGLLDSREQTLLNRLVSQYDGYSSRMPKSEREGLKAKAYNDALTVAESECGLRPSKKGDKPLARMLAELAERDFDSGETVRYRKPKGEKPKEIIPEKEQEM